MAVSHGVRCLKLFENIARRLLILLWQILLSLVVVLLALVQFISAQLRPHTKPPLSNVSHDQQHTDGHGTNADNSSSRARGNSDREDRDQPQTALPSSEQSSFRSMDRRKDRRMTKVLSHPLQRRSVPCPSARAASSKQEILAGLSNASQTRYPSKDRAISAAVLANIAADSCERWRITLQDLEALALPAWGLDVTFADRGAWHTFAGPDSTSPWEVLGELQNLRGLPSGDHSARWVELLDGTVLARLMTDGHPTCIPQWACVRTINSILSSLRRVPWDPARSWIFPEWHRKRMIFLSWVGKQLRLRQGVWREVLAFLPFEHCKLGAAKTSSRNMGKTAARERTEYYSTTHKAWISCKIVERDPATGCVMIDVKPGCWLTTEEQTVRLRLFSGDN